MFKKLLFNKFIILLVVVFLTALQQQKASANSSRWVDYEQGKVRLIAANIGQDNLVPYLGLQFSILPGWKIFWRSPGEAGYPLEINNIKSKNVSLNEIQWPYPERFEFGGIYTYGYNKDVVLPLKLDLDDKNLDGSISLKLEFLTCKDVCIPKQVNLSIPNLTFNQHKNSDIESLLKEYLGKVPKKVIKSSENNKIFFVPSAKSSILKIFLPAPKIMESPDIFIETVSGVNFQKPTFTIIKAKNLLEINLPIKNDKKIDYSALINNPVILTFVSNKKAEEYSLYIRIKNTDNNNRLRLSTIIFLAILGGFILNFMPCVLPVLSLKVMNFMDKKPSDKKLIKASFLFNILGIISTFIFLAVLIIFAKLAGVNLGWGFHFQEPIFTYLVFLVVLFFSLNLFDLIQIKIPYWFFPSSNINQSNSSDYRLSFFNGFLATLLATPCTAPIIGTTVAFALQSSFLNVLIIFLCMGIGMSLLPLLFVFYPNLIFYLPKSGKWNLYIRRLLGSLLLLTAAWLFVVLVKQVDLYLLIIILFSTAMIYLYILIKKFISWKINIVLSNIALFTFVIIIIITIFFVYDNKNSNSVTSVTYVDSKNINKLVSSGKVVFVDITAEWCITCKVNKYFVLETDDVKTKLKDEVIYIEVDWTRRDLEVLKYINSFNRSGIPLNIIYGKIAPNGIVLPEILSKDVIFRAIDIAKGSQNLAEKQTLKK